MKINISKIFDVRNIHLKLKNKKNENIIISLLSFYR